MSIERALGSVLFVVIIIFLLHIAGVHAEERYGHEHHHGWQREVLPYFIPYGAPTPYRYYEPAQRCWYNHEGRYVCRWVRP